MLSRHCESSGFLRRKSTFVTLVYRGAGQPSVRARDTTRRVARAAHSTMACARSRFHVRYNIASRFVFPAQILFSKATMRQRTPSIVVIKLSKIALLPTMSVPLGYHGTPARDRKRNVFPARQRSLTQQASPSSWRSGALRHNPRRTDVLASSRMRPPTEGSPLPTKDTIMLKAAPRRSDPAHPPSLPAQPRKHRRAHRPDGALLFAGAVASFGLALVLIGAAVSFAAGHQRRRTSTSRPSCSGILGSGLRPGGLGMMLALREKKPAHAAANAPRHPCRADPGRAGQSGPHAQGVPIAKLILQHQSYATIAAERHLAVRTVQFHATNIFRKAYVSNRRDFRACHPGRRAQRRPERRRPSRHSLLPQQQTTPPDGRGAARPGCALCGQNTCLPGAAPTTRRRASRAKPWQRARARRSRPSRWQPHDPPQQGGPAPRQAGGRTAIASAVR